VWDLASGDEGVERVLGGLEGGPEQFDQSG
jgi:hypothetical protein